MSDPRIDQIRVVYAQHQGLRSSTRTRFAAMPVGIPGSMALVH